MSVRTHVLEVVVCLMFLFGSSADAQAPLAIHTQLTPVGDAHVTLIVLRDDDGSESRLEVAGVAAVVDVATSPDGLVAVLGSFNGTLFGGDAAYVSKRTDLFLGIFDEMGQLLSLEIYGSQAHDAAHAIVAARNGFTLHVTTATGPARIRIDAFGEIVAHLDGALPIATDPIEDHTGEDETEDPEG